MFKTIFVFAISFGCVFTAMAQEPCQIEVYTTLFGGNGTMVCADSYDQHSITLQGSASDIVITDDGNIDMGGVILARKWTFNIGNSNIVCTPKSRESATAAITKGSALVQTGKAQPTRYDYIYDADEESITLYKMGTTEQAALLLLHF